MTAAFILLSLVIAGSGVFVALAVYHLHWSDVLVTDQPTRAVVRTVRRPKPRLA